MTDVLTAPAPEPEEPSSGGVAGRGLLVAAVIAVLVAAGVGLWIVVWMRRGGPRRAITELAEDGAVKLADALIDQVLPAA
jgi:hypothetical protein